MTGEQDNCQDQPFDAAGDPARCLCKGAALRAYNGLLQSGMAEEDALDAAWRVYRFHHPEDAPSDARLIVERWIYAGAERAH